MKLNILRADPAGNITIFVLDPVERAQRAHIAARIMALPGLGCEQVGFLCQPREGGDGRMEMMGGEFCGNATRAFGLLLAQKLGGPAQVRVETSGCDHVVTVDTDLAAGTARSEMPLPLWLRPARAAGHSGTLVHLGGIAHLVVEDAEPSLDFFQAAEPLFRELEGLDAYGVIFLDTAQGKMTPLVKVPATDTLVWEGSCGSGSLAAALSQSAGLEEGEFARDYLQPAGVVRATVVRRNGSVTAAYIGGPVTLGQPMEVEL